MNANEQLAAGGEADRIDLTFLRTCVDDAVEASMALWDSNGKTFWRSTEHREREAVKGTPKFFPTVTLRCIEALLSLTVEYPEWTRSNVNKMVFEEMVASLVERDHATMESTLNPTGTGKELNLFTLSLYVQVFSRICAFKNVTLKSADIARPRLEASAVDLLNHSAFKSGTGGAATAEHPFVLFHVCRALSLCVSVVAISDTRDRAELLLKQLLAAARESVDRLLPRHRLGALNPGEAVALGFCAASLGLFGQREDYPFIAASLEVCFESQDPWGCWALGRVIRKNKDIEAPPLEIPTYEIAGVIAEIMYELAKKAKNSLSSKLGREAVERLVRAGRYVERTIVRMPDAAAPQVGWCGDHAYGAPLVESWTSAIVLQSLLSLHELVQETKRRRILGTFTSTFPDDREWPGWLRWKKFRVTGEVDVKHPVLSYLEEKVIKPIIADPRGLPPMKPRSVSVLLFGPPGTSKTTIVRAVADGLGWPIVTLSPGNFIERGLEFIEAQAKRVFDSLLELSRAVVIFDECDELFRDRSPLESTEQTRGITAFVTASMLPKLQELHDRGKVLFFICTNNFESMDPAVKRGGRIDHIIGVGSPDLESRKRIVTQTWDDLKGEKGWKDPKFFGDAMEEVPLHTERFTRSEIQRVVRYLGRGSGWASSGEARSAAVAGAKRLEGALTISMDEFKRFGELRDRVSQAVTEGI
jgi:hypothetical protein